MIFKSSWGLEWEKKEKALVFSGFGFDVVSFRDGAT